MDLGIYGKTALVTGGVQGIGESITRNLLNEGVYVIGFYSPVVPEGKARIRVQISASMKKADLEKAIIAFKKVGKLLKII